VKNISWVLYIIRCKKGPRSWSAVAKLMRVSRSYLCDVMGGRKRPGPKVLRWVGVEAVEGYQWKSDRRTRKPR